MANSNLTFRQSFTYQNNQTGLDETINATVTSYTEKVKSGTYNNFTSKLSKNAANHPSTKIIYK